MGKLGGLSGLGVGDQGGNNVVFGCRVMLEVNVWALQTIWLMPQPSSRRQGNRTLYYYFPTDLQFQGHQGCPNNQITAQLYISNSTNRYHRIWEILF